MPQININQKLDELLATKFETEVIEFKEAKNDFSFEELGKYFSALSNEANLHNVGLCQRPCKIFCVNG